MPLPTNLTAPRLAPLDNLLALAPLHLPNLRAVRYVGDDIFIGLDQLVETDRSIVRDLYEKLNELLYSIADEAIDDERKWVEIKAWLGRHDLDLIVDDLRALGIASHADHPSEALAKAIHDVRGGALSALIGRLGLLDRTPRDENHLKVLFVLARDHLKIMRNAIVGLDEERRDADRTPRLHAMSLMVEKWHESIIGPKFQERPVRMAVDCRYEGGLTECCLESAAIDRIFYNLANNACRHVLGDRLEMAIFPIPEPPGECLRFVLSNPVGARDAEYLRALAPTGGDSVDRGKGESLLALFEPEFSSTGSGFGLTVVAEFVAGAFGLPDRAEALRERYVGAILDGEIFRVWFHWPMARADLPQKVDDYHRPADSLSEPG